MSSTASRERRRRTTSALAVALLLLLLGSWSTAAAFWSAGGSGSGSGASDAPVPVTLSPSTPLSQLYPGGLADVSLTATNTNRVALRLTALSLDTTRGSSGFDVDAAHAGCDTSSLSFTTQTNGGAGWTVPASGSLSLTLPRALAMGVGAVNACQGARFTVYLKSAP